MRHVDHRLCPMDALVFHLHIRFPVSKEHDEFDFGNNTTWFNRELICLMPKATKRKRKRTPLEQESIDEPDEVLGTLSTLL